MLPFNEAKKIPVFFYGKVKFSDLSGELIIKGPIKTAMIGFGQKFEISTTPKGISNFFLSGKLVFKNHAHIGNDYVIYIGEGAYCEFGNMSGLGSDVKLICKEKIIIGDWTGIAYESQIMDTNSHPMLNTETGVLYKMNGSIEIGSYNAISNRVTILLNTKTPDNIVVASNSLLNKNYIPLGEKVLIGGIPAKLIRNNFARHWEIEKANAIRIRVERN